MPCSNHSDNLSTKIACAISWRESFTRVRARRTPVDFGYVFQTRNVGIVSVRCEVDLVAWISRIQQCRYGRKRPVVKLRLELRLHNASGLIWICLKEKGAAHVCHLLLSWRVSVQSAPAYGQWSFYLCRFGKVRVKRTQYIKKFKHSFRGVDFRDIEHKSVTIETKIQRYASFYILQSIFNIGKIILFK